jgi:DNA-binding Lrp family transcriptional regulator
MYLKGVFMSEIVKIKEFLRIEPLETVENPDTLSLEEQFRLFLPSIVSEEDKQLLTEFFVYKYKGEKEVEEGAGEKFKELVIVDSIMGGEFLPLVVSKLRQMNKYKRLSGEILTSEQFRQTLFNMVYDYRVRLDAKDLMILNAMCNDLFISIADIQKQTSMSYKTALYHKKDLEDRCRLRVCTRLDYSKIGLSNLLILVDGEANVESPYLLSRQEVLGMDLYTFFSIAVPSSAVNQVYKDFLKRFSKLWVWEVEGFEGSSSFGFYDADKGDWNIDWDSWSLYLSNVLSKGWDRVIPQKKRIEEPVPLSEPPKKRKRITTEDLKIIVEMLERADKPTLELSKKLEYDMRAAERTKNSLFEGGILLPYLSIEHIGLSENILFIVESDTNTLNAFVVAVRELPKAWIYWMKPFKGEGFPALACLLETPPGSITPLERVLRQTLLTLADYKLCFRSKQEGSQYPLPKLFDPQTETWKWSPEMLKIYVKEGGNAKGKG